ncbi:MAG: hypothetical protein HY718_03635 [Planctomycetes bacterium]|nr:hypothetical protein [Planctomycetota bacterium]
MSRHRGKHKKSPVLEYRRQSTEELRSQIERARQAGDVRGALDMAKECHRRESTPDHARLLGALHVERARQLMAKNLYTEATVVLSHALALGHGDEELLRMVFECGLRSGQYQSALAVFRRLQNPEARARARGLLADEAVARGDDFGRLCESPIREDASRIQRAFAAFERGNDDAAAAELRPIGLNSPCAGWKWLLLGLVAYAQGDEIKARGCWSRTGFEGRADRLIGLLRSVLDPGQPSQDGPPRLRSRLLGALGDPRLAMLEQIKESLSRNAPLETLRLSRQLIASVDPAERESYARRLGRALCRSLDWDELDNRMVERTFGRMPEDPRQMRALALWYEFRDPAQAVCSWHECVDELEAIPSIPERLKGRAAAMIWSRMGDLAERAGPEEMAEVIEECGHHRCATLTPVTCYRTSIKHYPNDRKTHEKLMEALIANGSHRLAERQAEEILKRWPTDVKSLVFLGKACFERDAMRKALKYFDRARQAEPFNAEVRREAMTCLLFSARRRLDKGNVKLARVDYEQAESLTAPGDPVPDLYCKWAALEWRVGDAQRAEARFAKALAGRSTTLPVYYRMAIEAARAPAPSEIQDRFERRLAEEWKSPPTGAEAVELVGVAMAHSVLGIRYARQHIHARALMHYLERACREATFTEDQFLLICHCLHAESQWSVLETYAEKASGQCPGDYHFPLYLGRAQGRRLNGRLPRPTQTLLDRAGRQATQAGDLAAAAELAVLLDIARSPRSLSVRMFDAILDMAERLGFATPADFDDREPLPRPRRRRREAPGQLRLFDEPAEAGKENA